MSILLGVCAFFLAVYRAHASFFLDLFNLWRSSSDKLRFRFGLHVSEQNTGLGVSLPHVLHNFTLEYCEEGFECRRTPALLKEAEHDREQNFTFVLPFS